MKVTSEQWVVKLQSDQVKGPYSTQALIKMIINGAFSGNEEICAYPEGEWQLLTKQPEFYDALLESLENPVEVDNKKAQKMDAETVIRIPEYIPKHPEIPAAEGIKNINDLKELLERERKTSNENNSTHKNTVQVIHNHLPVAQDSQNNDFNAIKKSQDKNLEIQLTDIKKLKQNELKKLFPIVLLAIIALAAIIYFFLPSDENVATGWVLIAPKINAEKNENLSDEELKNLKRAAVRAFQSGIYENILLAQKSLVKAIEASPKDIEAMGLLCMAHQQLWPYTKQNNDDIKSILIVTQLARSINPISNYSDSCQVVYLLVKGQNKEARSLLEKTLDNQVDEKFSISVFLYLIKGEMFEAESSFIEAEAYYETAVKLWPQWVTAKLGLAKMLYKKNKLAASLEQYMAVYNTNKESKAALFGLGLIEVKGSKNTEKALGYFSSGFKLKQQLPKDFFIESILNYVHILTDKNEKKLALEVVEAGYKVSPSHRGIKELLISLGGDDKTENPQSEIILIGDQFARAGDHMVAQAHYKTAFELDSKNANAAFKAAKSLWQINQTRNAISWLDKCIQADSNHIQAYILKADYESQKYNFINAARTLQLASRKFVKNHEVLKAQALLELRKNNIAGAIQYGERAIKMYNADVELLTLLAQAHILYYLNAPAASKDAVNKKNESIQNAKVYSGKAIDLEPAWPEAQITYAKYLEAHDGPIRAEIYFKELIKTFPYTIEYRLAFAEFYRKNEKFSEAAVVYEEVVGISAKNKKGQLGLAETYRILNKPDLAQAHYNIASLLDTSDVEPLFLNAKLLIETAAGNQIQAKIEKALAKLIIVKNINPEFPKVSYLMAKCYLLMSNADDYEKAITLIKEEKSKNPYMVDSFILAAEIYQRKGQFKECADEYSTAIKLKPSSAELYVQASICYRKSDSIDIAEDMLVTALQKESGYPEIYREQGYIFQKRGYKPQAIAAFEKYLGLSPNASDKDEIQAIINN